MTETKPWPVPFWVYTALTVLALGLTILFLQETYYDRSIPAAEQPPRGSRPARLVGIAQWRSRHLRNTFGQAVWRTVQVVLKPTVLLSCLTYMLVSAMCIFHSPRRTGNTGGITDLTRIHSRLALLSASTLPWQSLSLLCTASGLSRLASSTLLLWLLSFWASSWATGFMTP